MKANARTQRKLRRWRDQHHAQSEQVKDVIARLEGRVRKCYVLARSYTQFCNWVEGPDGGLGAPPADQYIPVTSAGDLVGVRLSAVVVLFELEGWDQHVADADLVQRVRVLKAIARQ